MTIDTDFKNIASSKIEPFKALFNSADASRIAVQIRRDNLYDRATFTWQLYDDNGNEIIEGVEECTGDDYNNWNGDNTFPFTFIAAKLGLTLI